jgi:hypothetical protein
LAQVGQATPESLVTSSTPQIEWYRVSLGDGFTFQGARKKPRLECT